MHQVSFLLPRKILKYYKFKFSSFLLTFLFAMNRFCITSVLISEFSEREMIFFDFDKPAKPTNFGVRSGPHQPQKVVKRVFRAVIVEK